MLFGTIEHAIWCRQFRYRTSKTPNRTAIPGFETLQGFDHLRYAARMN